MSRLSYLVSNPGIEKACTTFTAKSSYLRICTFRLLVLVVRDRGVKSVPLRHTRVSRMLDSTS